LEFQLILDIEDDRNCYNFSYESCREIS
jgi:hypothetical protein